MSGYAWTPDILNNHRSGYNSIKWQSVDIGTADCPITIVIAQYHMLPGDLKLEALCIPQVTMAVLTSMQRKEDKSLLNSFHPYSDVRCSHYSNDQEEFRSRDKKFLQSFDRTSPAGWSRNQREVLINFLSPYINIVPFFLYFGSLHSSRVRLPWRWENGDFVRQRLMDIYDITPLWTNRVSLFLSTLKWIYGVLRYLSLRDSRAQCSVLSHASNSL